MDNNNFNYINNKVVAVFYILLGVGFAFLAVHYYLAIYYQAILLPTLLTPVFFALGLWRWQTASQLKYDPAAILALLMLGVFLLLQPEMLSDIHQWHWVGLCYPLLTFYLLPNSLSLIFSFLLLIGWVNLRLHNQIIIQDIIFSTYFLLLTFIAWVYSIRNKIEVKKIEQLMGIDKETGLFNSHYLNKCLNAEVSRARVTKKPLSLLLIELHQYPEIKQELGESLAKSFIKDASLICQKSCRIGDEAYRYDIQTLLILIPNTTINGSLVLRTRLYQNLLQTLICDIGPLDITITPLELKAGEQLVDFQARIANSCYHSLSERVEDSELIH